MGPRECAGAGEPKPGYDKKNGAAAAPGGRVQHGIVGVVVVHFIISPLEILGESVCSFGEIGGDRWCGLIRIGIDAWLRSKRWKPLNRDRFSAAAFSVRPGVGGRQRCWPDVPRRCAARPCRLGKQPKPACWAFRMS